MELSKTFVFNVKAHEMLLCAVSPSLCTMSPNWGSSVPKLGLNIKILIYLKFMHYFLKFGT